MWQVCVSLPNFSCQPESAPHTPETGNNWKLCVDICVTFLSGKQCAWSWGSRGQVSRPLVPLHQKERGPQNSPPNWTISWLQLPLAEEKLIELAQKCHRERNFDFSSTGTVSPRAGYPDQQAGKAIHRTQLNLSENVLQCSQIFTAMENSPAVCWSTDRAY